MSIRLLHKHRREELVTLPYLPHRRRLLTSENGNDKPLVAPRRIFLSAIPLPDPFPFVPIGVPLPDLFRLQSSLGCDIEERGELGPAGVEACYHPHAGVVLVGEEVLHGLRESVVFAVHPQTVCAEYAGEVVRVGF